VRAAVLGALAQLVPSRLPACTGGSEFGVVIAGRDKQREPFLLLEFHNVTGHGGGPDWDGQDGGPFCLSNLANVPVEVLEAENPVVIDEYAFLPNTGGPGRYRGALGIVRQYRLLADEAMIQLRSDRQIFPPWGLFGGKPGSCGNTVLNPGSDGAQKLPSKFIRQIKRGDVFRGEMPGSGGYGDPLERTPEAVAEDVRQEKMSVEHARGEYGVVMTGTNVDVAGTAGLREQMILARAAT